MSFRHSLVSAAFASLFFLQTGCGLLGGKEATDRMLNYASNSIGCMNAFGQQAQDYVDGAISSEEWSSSMDCIHGSLTMFQRFVTPSDSQGYSLEDVRVFASMFMITKRPITKELVAAGFELKSSLFGGDSAHISPRELARLVKIVDSLKSETLGLLPHLKKVRPSHPHGGSHSVVADPPPSNDDVFAFMDALEAAAKRLSKDLELSGTSSFSVASAEALVMGAGQALGIPVESGLASVGFSLKTLLLGGSDTSIAGADWASLLEAFGVYGGPAYLAVKSTANPNPALIHKLNDKMTAALAWSMNRNGGSWPLNLLDKAIDRAPASWMTFDRAIVKNALRPLAGKLLWSKTAGAFDSSALRWIHDRVDDWYTADTHIRNIYEKLKTDHSSGSDFIAAAQKYSAHLPKEDKDSVSRIISLVQNYLPLFDQGDEQIRYFGIKDYSLNQVLKLNWMNLAAVWVLKSYSTDPSHALASIDDVHTIFNDYLPIAGQLKLMDSTIPGLADMRFRDISLFTPASVGGDQLTVEEVTYFIGFANSIGVLSLRIRDRIAQNCPAVGADPYGTSFVQMDCFSREFFGRRMEFWDHFDELLRFYDGSPADKQGAVQAGLEASGRLKGITNDPIGRYDIEGYAGTAHYVESMFARFDLNQDGILDLDEVMAAYPVFKGLLVRLGKLDPSNDSLIQGVFTYIVKYGEVPKQDAKFVGWLASRPFWSISADRASIYQVLSSMVGPPPS